MPDPLTVVSLLKTAVDGLKGMAGVVSHSEIRDAVRTVEDRLSDTRSAVYDLQENALRNLQTERDLRNEVEQLKKQIASYDDWKLKEQFYPLRHPLGWSVAVRVFDSQKAKELGEPDAAEHTICPVCFEAKRISILRPNTRGSSRLICSQCKFDVFDQPAPREEHYPSPNFCTDNFI